MVTSGSFARGFRPSPGEPEENATQQIFDENFRRRKRGVKKTVEIMVRRSIAIPAKKSDCVKRVLACCEECGTRNVLNILFDLGTRREKALKEACLDFIVEICDKS